MDVCYYLIRLTDLHDIWQNTERIEHIGLTIFFKFRADKVAGITSLFVNRSVADNIIKSV